MFGSAVRSAARGARHLDEAASGWETKIDIFTLDVSCPYSCPLAQVRPGGRGFHGYCNSQRVHAPMGHSLFALRHGFDAVFSTKYDRLNEAWRAEVTKRIVNTIIEEVQSETIQVKESVNG